MKKKSIWTSLILAMFLILMAVPVPASAQEGEYGIRLRRDFGYGAGSNVRGTFTISLAGDESRVASVEFLIDGEVMATVEEAPYRFQFHTDNYGFGVHQLSARVFLYDGMIETTPTVGLNFLSPDEERGSLTTLFIGIGGVLIVGLVIYGLVQVLVFKKKPAGTFQPGKVRSYGLLGGTICPKCGRAFSRHVWGLNLVTGRWDRCGHCGKWSMTVRATPEELRAAEEAEWADLQPSQEEVSPQGEVKDTLEDTRYVDEI